MRDMAERTLTAWLEVGAVRQSAMIEPLLIEWSASIGVELYFKPHVERGQRRWLLGS